MVADIMNRLGARSRFQAGVKAADRGWLMERAGLMTTIAARTLLVAPGRHGAYPTIGEALGNAPDGGVIAVAAGTYAETFELADRQLTHPRARGRRGGPRRHRRRLAGAAGAGRLAHPARHRR